MKTSMTNVDTYAPGIAGFGSYQITYVCGPTDIGLGIHFLV